MNRLLTILAVAGLTSTLLLCNSARADATGSDAKAKQSEPATEAGSGGATAKPVEQALPPGHPPISSKQPKSAMPAGHPPVAPKTAELPAGHPPIQPKQANPGLPAGHPEIAPKGGVLAEMPATTAGTGAITIQAVQGTVNGPPIGNAQVTIQLFHRGQVLAKFSNRLNDAGKVTFADLPLGMPFQPLVTINHSGVDYQAAGELMDRKHPGQEIQMHVYETTDAEPAWKVKMRHIMAEPTTEGLHVMEMLAIENPADRSWIGKANEKGERRTLALPLPAGAIKAKAANGAHDCCAVTVNGMLIDSMPLIPGVTQFQFEYFVPITNNAVSVTLKAPADVQHTMLFVPMDGSTVEATGLQTMGASPMADAKARMYRAAPMKAGDAVSFTITGLTADLLKATAPAPEQGADAAPVSSNMPQVIAGIGAAVILVPGLAVVFMKPRARQS